VEDIKIDDAISNRLKEIFECIQSNYNITLQEWNHDKDHVHIVFKAHPNSEISKFLNSYKTKAKEINNLSRLTTKMVQ